MTELQGLDALENLVLLVVKRNYIKEIKNLDKLKNLIRLNLAFNQITGINGLATLNNLEMIDLRGNPIYSKEITISNKRTRVKFLDAKDLVHYCQTIPVKK
ncbi:MAG: hypothetical protein BAJALOKI1v1_620001 [Promethearchaeota archaeon]|nr:MAG: hypothetical protein BAJALOKI1v1_620001 [Candidatus Lokiarchaeota archaeon]